MAHNSFRQFGLGDGRPPIRNEAGFAVASAATADNGAPLPGLMAMMRLGDPIAELLPPESVEGFRAIELKRDEAHVVVRATVERQQELRLDILQHQNHINKVKTPRGAGGPNLDDSSAQVIAEQKKLDRKLADQRRLTASLEASAAIWNDTSNLIRNIEQYVAGRPGGCIGKTVTIDTPSFKGNVLDAIENRRRRGRELKADLHRVRSSPWPSTIAKTKERQRNEQRAESGRPFAERAIEHDEQIPFPTRTHQVRILNGAPDLIGFVELPDMLAILSWLHRDAMTAALDREIDQVADDPNAMTHEQRQKAETQILADLLAVEREECALVRIARAQDLPADYRIDCDARAILEFAWAIGAPPPPREGEGQAGVVRHVGSR